MVQENALNIYTDGSSLPRPRRGGIGVVYIVIGSDGHEQVTEAAYWGYESATNQQMEVLAAIKGLEDATKQPAWPRISRVVVYSDSRYLVDNVTSAKFLWPKNRWRNANGKLVDNADLWKRLVKILKTLGKRVDFEWVKGHSRDKHNKRVDKLAKASAKGFLQAPLRVGSVRRKTTTQSVALGSVSMLGQTLAVRIVTDEFQRIQRVYKYKYEVLEGEHAGKMDIIYSPITLRAGHHYSVRVCDDPKNPQILECLEELERPATKRTQT